MTSAFTPGAVSRLAGFDNAGEVFMSGDRIFRGIYRGQAEVVRQVLRTCEKHDLFSHGIVATRELDRNPHPELDYEMVLEHERIPFVTYPHEWAASMFKEAALLHLALYERLEEHGLTLKDWHPLNILFSGTSPVFVDFTSIIPIDRLASQPHLRPAHTPSSLSGGWDSVSKALYEAYRVMYEPYFGLPLAMMDQGHHAKARKRIYETTLNTCNEIITRREVFDHAIFDRIMYEIEERMLRLALNEKGPRKPRFFRRIRHTIAKQKAALKGSAYSSYYEDKNEAFAAEPGNDWTNKQHGVHRALTTMRPATVLDLGSNTGWFSMLAAKLGSKVVAVDLDEASIDRLFADARREKADILPLVANLVRPLPELPAKTFEDEPSLSLIGDGKPVIAVPGTRLRCEMVMALAIVHHLALGQAHPFDEIAGILGRLATKYLCVEFVALDDKMITGDPGFFPAYNAAKESFSWYSKENFVSALGFQFDRIEEIPSYPETRTLLLCSRT